MRKRFFAFLIHISASASLAALALALVFFLWYPSPLHLAAGVSGIVLLLIGVDVVIGPMLTFVVYNPAKKSLRFDLTVIVALQLAAFIYGMGAIAEGRPAWLVYNADRFDVVQAYNIDDRRLDQASPTYRRPSWFGPKWVAAKMPSDVEQRNTLTLESVFAGVDIPQRPDLYHPLMEARAEIQKHALPLERLQRFNPPAAVTAVLARWPQADAFLPMMGKAHSLTVLIRKETAEVVAITDLNPWEP